MSSIDRLKASFMDAVRAALRGIDFYAHYSAKVVSQNADGSVDVTPDDARLSDMRGVPVRLGTPGLSAKIPAGARVMIGFDAGDPSKPYASVWDDGSVTQIQVSKGTRGVAAQGDVVSVTLPPGTTFNGVASPPVGPFVGTFLLPVTMTGVILGGSAIFKVP